MTSLKEIQSAFREAMFGDSTAVAAAGQLVNASDHRSGEEHVRIYRQTVLGTLTTTLADIFPVSRRLVGESFFDAMAGRYIPSTPSRSPDLANFGDSFPAFIAEFTPAAELPYLADVALLEWYWHRAFHAADEAPLNSNALRAAAECQAERIVFRLPISARLLESGFPIRRIWHVNQPGHAGDSRVSLDIGGDRLIVWRSSTTELRIDELDANTWQFLNHVAAGDTLRQLSETNDIELMLPMCAQHGWLGSFETLIDKTPTQGDLIW